MKLLSIAILVMIAVPFCLLDIQSAHAEIPLTPKNQLDLLQVAHDLGAPPNCDAVISDMSLNLRAYRDGLLANDTAYAKGAIEGDSAYRPTIGLENTLKGLPTANSQCNSLIPIIAS